MPFSTNEVPERLKDKGIPAHFIRLFVQVFNSVLADTKDEGRAYKAAYSKMGEALRKGGYYKSEDGKWSKEEVAMDNIYENNREGWKAAWKAATHPGHLDPGLEQKTLRRNKPQGITINRDNTFVDVGEEHREESFISSSTRPVEIVEEVPGGGLRYRGVALVDEAISDNDRYYSQAFNDKAMEATNAFMAAGGTVTIYSRHGKAIAKPGELPTALPVGKVSEPLARNNSEIWYVGYISPTTEGKDCIQLIRDKVMAATSIRSHSYKSRQRKMNGHMVQEMLEGVIHGIDLTDEAGIHGAGIREVLESPQFEEETMDWKDVTLEELQTNRQDLLDGFAADAVEAAKAQIAEEVKKAQAEKVVAETARTAAEAQLAEIAKKVSDGEQTAKVIVEERDAAKVESTAKDAQLAALTLKLSIAQAAHIGSIPQAVYATLVEEVKTEADIARLLPGARSKAMTAHLSGEVGSGIGKGITHFDKAEQATEEAGIPDEKVAEGAQKILTLCM